MGNRLTEEMRAQRVHDQAVHDRNMRTVNEVTARERQVNERIRQAGQQSQPGRSCLGALVLLIGAIVLTTLMAIVA